jgi:hypothetical protein
MKKTKILMKNGHFDNGEPQLLYFSMDHPDKNLQGKFKGMAVILQEQGLGTCQRCLHLIEILSANLEQHAAAVARSSTISQTLLMQNHCSKLTAILTEFMLSFCQSSTVN